MIFAVGREIIVVTFKIKIMILIIKLDDEGWNFYAFPLVGWKKVLFHQNGILCVTAGHPDLSVFRTHLIEKKKRSGFQPCAKHS